jgi:hypothetical protein
MKKKHLLFIFITTLLFTLASCNNSQKPAIGNEDDIIVIADSVLYSELEGEMLHVFERIIYTPQAERLFNLMRKDFRKFSKLQNRKNIIILGTLDSNDPASNYIKSSLDSSVTSLVKKNKAYFFNKNDPWAKDQLVMYLVSNTVEDLKRNILNANEELLYAFRNISNHRLFSTLYKPRLENKKIEAELLSKYKWSIYVQPEVELAKSDSANNFVWLRSGRNRDIERWMFIHWIDNADANYLREDSLMDIRNRITKKYFRVSDDSIYVNLSYNMSKPKVQQSNFNNRYALMCQGFWKFSDKSGGGPFISYSFLDEESGRFYMIDASIFAPKYYKKKLLQRADVILNSFRTINELTEERIEDILSVLE